MRIWIVLFALLWLAPRARAQPDDDDPKSAPPPHAAHHAPAAEKRAAPAAEKRAAPTAEKHAAATAGKHASPSRRAEPAPASQARPVRVHLADGTTVFGTVVAEEPEALVIDCSLGRLSIPRERISTIAYDTAAELGQKRAPVQQLDDLPSSRR